MIPMDTLIEAARAAAQQAYAPYSKFTVGAALLDDQGNIHVGCNVENVSYGLTVCAERVALWGAIAKGARRFKALALSASECVMPCGACRQVLSEFCDASLLIMMTDHAGRVTRIASLGEIFPEPFKAETL